MHTVELLPDEALSSGVRDLWDRLLDAGLPSLATHRHPTNRPHLTLLTTPTPVVALPPLPLPTPVTLGPVRLLGRALVLAADDSVRPLQASVWSALGGGWPAPADWVPHVSLALRVPAALRARAGAVLAGAPAMSGSLIAARSYDTETRTVRELPAHGGSAGWQELHRRIADTAGGPAVEPM